MCRSCDAPLIARDLIISDFGTTNCHTCGEVIQDAHYWNADSRAARKHDSLHVFMASEHVGVCCVECGDVPYDETDGVTVNNFGDYVCCCGGTLEEFNDEV